MFFTLCVLDHNADLPQHLLVDLTDGVTQGGNALRGIEVENCHEILMVEILFRLQTAAGHQRISDTDRCRRLKLQCDVKVIILFQKRTVNDAANVMLVVLPVVICQHSGHISKLLGKPLFSGNIKAIFQHGLHRRNVSVLQFPQKRAAGVFPFAGIGNIKDIAQTNMISAVIQQGDAGGATADIAAHSLVPQFIVSTGRRIRALGINHQLFMERVLIEPGCGGQKGRPFLPAAGQLNRHVICHLRILFCFCKHGFSSFQLLE